MQSRTEYEVQEHDGLKWEFVTRRLAEDLAVDQLNALVKVFKGRAFRVLELPTCRVVKLYDPRPNGLNKQETK